MSRPEFLAVADRPPEGAQGLVICLGRPASSPGLPAERLLVFDRVNAAAMRELSHLDPRRMADGLALVTASAEYERAPGAVLQAHKLLALLFVKFVDMPAQSGRVPDVLGLRHQTPLPEFLHQLNQWRNTPLHLRCPLAEKLAEENVGLPCLLLMPGPSLARLGDALPELAKRHLVVTISRTLPFLRARGVEPDVLVQLDTLPMQAHFHTPDENYPNAVLLSLSLAPVSGFARHFRHTFFIDSFNLSLLPNPWRLRESWTSSLLACLGALEALAAPVALLAGADLRTLPDAFYYDGGDPARTPEPPAHAGPPLCDGQTVRLADADGRQAQTPLQFFAAAAEAELFARDIHRARGTRFRNLSRLSLLDRHVFSPMDLAEALDAPVLDKTPFLEKADLAAKRREAIDLPAAQAWYAEALAQSEHGRDLLTTLALADPAGVTRHPCHAYVTANLPWFRPATPEGVLRCARGLANELCDAARFARNTVALFRAAGEGRTLPVLVTAEEETEVLQRLAAFAPGWDWRPVGVRSLAGGQPEPSGGVVDMAVLDMWLSRQGVALLAPGCAREFRYLTALLRPDNLLLMDELLGDAPQRPAT